MIADEPTRGVDVGAKRAIYDFLAELASKGLGVLLISSELEEVIGLSHRVLVMRRGRLVAELEGDGDHRGRDPRRRVRRHGGGRGVTSGVGVGESGGGRDWRSALGDGRVTARLRSLGILIPFTILFVVLSLTSSSFFTKPNLLNILDQQSATLIIAAAGTLVVIAGGIDLSVGAIYGFAGVDLGALRAPPQRRASRSCSASAPAC